MKVPMIIIRIPLYDYDQEDVPHPMNPEDVQEILALIKGRDDVAGYSIESIELVEEELLRLG